MPTEATAAARRSQAETPPRSASGATLPTRRRGGGHGRCQSAATSLFAGKRGGAPLGVVLHGSDIAGNVVETGGGGGFNCDPSGVFTLFDSPVFSVIGEGSHVGGNVTITGLTSCWLGLTHSRFDSSVHVLNNQLADPDAIEILDNDIAGNIVCEQNSMMWDSADITEALYPRMWEPNRVSGLRVGQCVVAPPLTLDGTSPGPF